MGELHLTSLTFEGDPDGAPDSVVVKMPSPFEENRQQGINLGMYEAEVRFYRELAPRPPTGLPRVHMSEIVPGTADFVIVMEDLSHLTFVDQATGMSPDQAQAAVEAMRIGAYDFLEKPFNPDRMNELAKKAANARRLTLDNRLLRKELSDGGQLMKKLIGASPVMERLKEDILDLGQADGHVLIEGETGTGKTLVAHALHAVGARAGKKFVLVSCAAMEEEALAKRLFGPMLPEDAQLPAVEEARGGTLVLEDIEALSEVLQAKLLSVINEQGTPAETRIIAICNMQEQDRTCEDALRPDLFYRLAALRITVPPLRQRGEDILTLFTRLGEQFAEEYGCETPQVTAQEAAQPAS